MGAITEKELRKTLKEQKQMDNEEQLLGRLLVENDFCREDDIAAALSAQRGMRSGRSVQQAVSVADMAIALKKSGNGRRIRRRVITKSTAVASKITACRDSGPISALLARGPKE
jgi:hypothetical protein